MHQENYYQPPPRPLSTRAHRPQSEPISNMGAEQFTGQSHQQGLGQDIGQAPGPGLNPGAYSYLNPGTYPGLGSDLGPGLGTGPGQTRFVNSMERRHQIPPSPFSTAYRLMSPRYQNASRSFNRSPESVAYGPGLDRFQNQLRDMRGIQGPMGLCEMSEGIFLQIHFEKT